MVGSHQPCRGNSCILGAISPPRLSVSYSTRTPQAGSWSSQARLSRDLEEGGRWGSDSKLWLLNRRLCRGGLETAPTSQPLPLPPAAAGTGPGLHL